MCAQHVPLPEDFFDGIDVVQLARTAHKPCSKCGHKQGVIVRGGVAFCQRCNNQRVRVAKQPKGERGAPAKSAPIVCRMPISTARPRARRSAARRATTRRAGDDGGGDGDGPPGRSLHNFDLAGAS